MGGGWHHRIRRSPPETFCLSLALWNGRDSILKERLFGLTNGEGNHGEDFKELYYYLDATPTHAYLKTLYKYPQREFPYADLVHANRSRGKHEPEYELLDTGVFDEDRYFDVFVEYGRINPTDVNMLITVHNRGPETAVIHLLRQLWFRNTWSWKAGASRPLISAASLQFVNVTHRDMGELPDSSFRRRTNGCLQTMKRMSDASMTRRRTDILRMPFTII